MLLAGLKTPQYSGLHCSGCCLCDLSPDNGKKMDGWTRRRQELKQQYLKKASRGRLNSHTPPCYNMELYIKIKNVYSLEI